MPDLGYGPLRRRDDEPIFAEPWHAQAMAIADLLIGSGTISQSKWTETLCEEVRLASLAGSADDTGRYYTAVLSALERILNAGGNVSCSELACRRDEWRRAYLHTPHGQPVELDCGRFTKASD
ncbi:hypothetical protein [Mesorhizobium sp. 131-2-1]|uniref:hypothetical protein n=1 Tax=Mesorhizobium sp. 131-2-1 TaxID=2744518 RepID=UPI00406D4ED1